MNVFFIMISLLFFKFIISSELYDSLEEDKIYFFVNDETFLINLIPNSLTKELISVLPLKTMIIEENKSSKILSLSVEINDLNENNLEKEANIGDLFLFNGKQLILFNEESTLEDRGEYIKIGFLEEPNKFFNYIEKTNKKSILIWNTLNYSDFKGKIKPTSIMNYLTLKVLTFFLFLLL